MVNLTDTIKEKWQSGGHQIAKIECTGLRYVSTGKLLDTADQTITSDRICDGGLSIDRTSISGSRLELGSAIAATLSLTLYNTDKKYDDVNFEGVEMKVSVALDEDSPTWIPLGVFIVDTPPRHLSTISISAMDRMVLFDQDASGFDYDTNSTVAEVIQACAKAAGVPLADTNMKNLPNYNVQVSKPETQSTITYRTLLQYCAALTGTFAYMNETGKLAFRWYDTTAGFATTPANRYSSDIYEQDVTITGLTYTIKSQDSEGKETSTVNVYGSADYAFDFTDNLLIAGNAARNQALTVVQSKIIPTTYRPYSAEILPAPWLFPGDAVTYLPVDKDDTAANRVFSVVTNMAYTLNGSTTIAGQGETAQSNSYASTSGLTAAQAQILQRVTDRVTQERTNREQAILQLNEQIKGVKAGKDDLLIAGLGLYTTEETLSDGSTVYYYHDKQTLDDSSIIYTFQSGGFAYTTNWNGGNPTWTSGFDRNGNLIMNTISTYKLEADDIQAGSITADKINTNYTTTIHDYADGKANSALIDAKKYADKQSSTAESNANGYTDGKLKDYSTTVEMNSAINQKADSITLKVSQTYVTTADYNTGISDTKKYADTQSNAALTDAKADTDKKLGEYAKKTDIPDLTPYVTKETMSSEIKASADQITLDVSKKYVTNENLTTEVESQVKISTDGFSSRVSAVENNLLYGLNYNLLKDTKAFGGVDSASDATLTGDLYAGLAVRYDAAAPYSTISQWTSFDIDDVQANRGLAISFYARSDSTGNKVAVQARETGTGAWKQITDSTGGTYANTGNIISYDSLGIEVSTSWSRYWVAFIPREEWSDDETLSQVRLYMHTGSGIYIAGVKLEYGTTATDWCPAASETFSGRRYSEIKQDIDSISLDATKIRLQATTLTWKAENSELKEDGTLTARGMFQSYEDVYTKDSKYGRNSIGFDNANGARLYARFRAWETAAQREAESDSGIVRTYYPVVIKGMPTDGNTGGEAGYGYAAFRYGQVSTIQIKGLTTPRFEMVNYWDASQPDERHPGVLLSLGQPTNGSYPEGAASKGGYLKLMRDDIQKGKSQDGVNLFLNSTGSGQLTLSHVTDTGDSWPKAQLVASDKNSWLWLGGSGSDYYNPGQALWYDFDSQKLNINANIKLSGLGFAKRWVSGFNYVANYAHLQTDSNIADANRLNTFAARLNMVFDDLYQITTWLKQTSGGTGFNTWQCT
ncbi:MAG: hypothetical protein UDP13_11725 [Butyricicoccus sp.]|nr:hypothetical protein [Butyricicoccus sp.]